MVLFPNGKINLGLYVTGKRNDGFHNIQTIFYPVALHDIVDIVQANEFSFTSSGLSVEGPATNNLCLKAYHLLKEDHPTLPPVSIHLYKNIPIGAGLGGGSSDAVACLQLLDRIAQLNLSYEQLSAYALQLGSDCPFFLVNKPCIASGRGEELTPIELDLSAFDIIIVNPGIHIATGPAFDSLHGYSSPPDLADIILHKPENWRDSLNNDFEAGVFKHFPEIKFIKEKLYEHGALYASLSGTGSTVYGLFEKSKRPDLHFPTAYFLKWV